MGSYEVDLMRRYSNQGNLTVVLESIRRRVAADVGKGGGRSSVPVPHEVRRRLTKDHLAAIVAQYEAGSTVNQLVAEHRLGKGTVLGILRAGERLFDRSVGCPRRRLTRRLPGTWKESLWLVWVRGSVSWRTRSVLRWSGEGFHGGTLKASRGSRLCLPKAGCWDYSSQGHSVHRGIGYQIQVSDA